MGRGVTGGPLRAHPRRRRQWQVKTLTRPCLDRPLTPPAGGAGCAYWTAPHRSGAGTDRTRSSFTRFAPPPAHPRPVLPMDATEADAFRLYRRCAAEEYAAVARVLGDALYGLRPGSWSLLDIGAGTGGVLDLLGDGGTSPPTAPHPGRYVGVERDAALLPALRAAVAARPGGDAAADAVLAGTAFEPPTDARWARLHSAFTVVLLLGSLSGCADKAGLLHEAATCVAPGGVVLAFHRHTAGRDGLAAAAAATGHPHRTRVLPARLATAGLSPAERATLAAYTRTPIPADAATVDRPVTYVAVAPFTPVPRAVTTARVSRAAAAHAAACTHLIPATVATIQVAVEAAHGRGSRVAAIGGGHSDHCLWPGAVAVDLRAWSAAAATADGTAVVAGGGATAGAITAAAAAVGRVVPLGDRPGTGAGLVLGGGVGHYARRWGLAADNLVGVTYVGADGEVRRAATAGSLWAFRGAGPHVGVALSLVLRAHPLRGVATQKRHYALGRSLVGRGSGEGVVASAAAALVAFSGAAAALPRDATADAFLYRAAGRVRLTVAAFETGDEHQDGAAAGGGCPPLGESVHAALMADVVPAEHCRDEHPAVLTPVQLPDAELYMTDTMDPPAPAGGGRRKWRSAKRCVLVPPLSPHLAAALAAATAAAPPGCYIHLLHAGGAAAAVAPAATAFGCRGWEWAAVVTARWAAAATAAATACGTGEGAAATVAAAGEEEGAARRWLAATAAALAPPVGAGVYPADLGPADTALAAHAWGGNGPALAAAARAADPGGVFGVACPLLPAVSTPPSPSSPPLPLPPPLVAFPNGAAGVTTAGETAPPAAAASALPNPLKAAAVARGRGALVLLCGRRGAGKDWLAAAARDALADLLSPAPSTVVVRSVSAGAKAAYAAATPGVDAGRLVTDRAYKEAHRRALAAHWAATVAADPAAPRRCLDDAAAAAAANGGRVVLLTGVRDGLGDVAALRGRLPTVAVHVTADAGARAAWGCPPDAATDASPGEAAAEAAEPVTWDLTFVNGPAVTPASVAAWTAASLAPALVRSTTRAIPDTPRPGVTYRDLVGGLLHQRWGLPLVVGLLERSLRAAEGSCGGGRGGGAAPALPGDGGAAVLVPEALGVAFGAPLAARLGVPLLVARRGGRLPGTVHAARYRGSNIRRLGDGAAGEAGRDGGRGRPDGAADDGGGAAAVLELVAGSVSPGQRVVAVDDTLASGATAAAAAAVVAAAGGTLDRLLVVAEFPDAGGRAVLRRLGVAVDALVTWPGV